MEWNPVFLYSPPVFGIKDPLLQQQSWDGCIYYWWYEYLKCNEEYAAICDHYRNPFTRNKPIKNGKLHGVFGDIQTLPFEDWWLSGQRGKELFSEKGINDYFQIIEDIDDIQVHEFYPEEEIAFIRVPLRTQSKRDLIEAFTQMLDKLHKGKIGRRTAKNTQAIYKVLGRPKIASLKLHLDIHKAKLSQPKRADWKIFQDFNLYNDKNRPEFSLKPPDDDSVNVMNAVVNRHRATAKKIIANTIKGRFPDYTKIAGST